MQLKKLPKVNQQLAERLGDRGEQGRGKGKEAEGASNPLGDERFAALFTNPDFQVDEESEVRVQTIALAQLEVCVG